MRMTISRVPLALGLLTLLAACTTTKSPAPVVERPPAPPRQAERPRPVQPNAQAPVAQRGFYTVKRGDTLLRIAQEFGQTVQNLVSWNNLSSPNDLKVDQVLRVLPPETPGTAAAPAASAPATGPTSAVPVNPGVEVRPLGQAPSGQVKTGPRGDKRPYSDATLAEMQRGEAPAARPEAKPSDQPEKPAQAGDSLELIWPTEGRLLAAFDPKRKGIDIAGKLGQPVLAAGPGQVSYVGSMRGYGNLVIVRHNENFLSAYAHNKTIVVKEGQAVTRGQKIAEMGNTDTDTVKLHFEVRQQGKPVDPTKFLPSR